MHMLKQASDTVIKTTVPDDEEYDLIEYLNLLREGICEAYTGIIQGMARDNKVDRVFPGLNAIMQFISHIAGEKQSNETVKRGAIGIIGDLCVSFQARVKMAVTHQQIQSLISECYESLDYSKETKETAAWARQLISQM